MKCVRLAWSTRQVVRTVRNLAANHPRVRAVLRVNETTLPTGQSAEHRPDSRAGTGAGTWTPSAMRSQQSRLPATVGRAPRLWSILYDGLLSRDQRWVLDTIARHRQA
jgi:hypothetical protein